MPLSIDEIKENNSVIQYAQEHGIRIRKEGDRSASFIDPGKNKTCVVYFRNWWYDHKVRQGGDVIDLCAILEHGGDRGQAIRALGGGGSDWIAPTQNLCNQIEKWHQALTPGNLEYLHERGINDQTIEELKIGVNRNRIIIPYWKNGYVCNWIGRTLKEVTDSNPKYLKAKKEGVIQSVPWGLQTLGKTDTLIITEGAFDALSFYQEGYSVLATMGGWFSKDQLKTVRSAVKSHKETYLVFDSDKPGQEFTKSLAEHLFRHHITSFSICNIPKNLKDVSEYYTKYGNVDGITDKPIDGLYYLAVQCDRAELKRFLFKAVRFTGIEDINILVDKLMKNHKFGEEWLKQIQKQLTKAPPQTMVADEILKEHNLIYSETSDFHEYVGSKWVKKTDTEIKAYIDRDLGNYTSNALVNSVLGIVKARCNSEIEFNKKHLMNFKNGTLELDTGVFRKPNPVDYLTIETSYDYDPNAKFDDFQDFAIDILDNQPEKCNLLQEIFGYVMFPENTLQKCAYFIGEGSNGKSVLLDVLTELYGEENVSSVDVSSLKEEFQRIQLKDSMVNIAPDIKADLKQSEDIFKRVIVGDQINGCYKGKDFINFKPHAKFIISANSMIKPEDDSYGMERRMLFVNFPVRFVENPKKPNEKKLDPNIKEKLLKELPGIFNWAYVGYKRLMQNQKFTETKEQEEMLEEFRTQANPVHAFLVEYLEGKTFFTTDDAYLAFCNLPTSRARLEERLTKRGFSMKLSNEIKNNYDGWTKTKRENVNGYRLKSN